MPEPIKPVLDHLDFDSGVISDAVEITERRLSDMPDHFQDRDAVRDLLEENPVLYHVYLGSQPGDPTGLYTGTTVIYPGRVGDEYFMTKGHFHPNAAAPEVYVTIGGQGMLVMQTRDGAAEVQRMEPGSIHNIPGQWAHRTVNVGDQPLVFLAIWPVDAGHDYGSIEEKGFARLVLAAEDGPRVVLNPHYE